MDRYRIPQKLPFSKKRLPKRVIISYILDYAIIMYTCNYVHRSIGTDIIDLVFSSLASMLSMQSSHFTSTFPFRTILYSTLSPSMREFLYRS